MTRLIYNLEAAVLAHIGSQPAHIDNPWFYMNAIANLVPLLTTPFSLLCIAQTGTYFVLKDDENILSTISGQPKDIPRQSNGYNKLHFKDDDECIEHYRRTLERRVHFLSALNKIVLY